MKKRKHRSAEHKAKIGEARKKLWAKPGERKRFSEAIRGRFGKSSGNTPPELTPNLKQAIRRRDDFRCQICGLKANGKHRRFDTHHIDDDRQNSHPDNMITLCIKCHCKTKKSSKDIISESECKRAIKRIKRINPEGHQAAIELYEQNMKIFY